MPDLLAGTTVSAVDFPPTVQSLVDPSYTITTTTYGTGTTGGTYSDCAVTFTAPTSGRVAVWLNARLVNNTATDGTLVCTETREGGVVGSGNIVDGVGDRGPSNYGVEFGRSGTSHMISGLTPGATYNCRVLHKVTAGTGSIALRELIVSPLS